MPVVETEITLKSCPFCGSEAFLKSDHQMSGQYHFWVKCSNPKCGVSPSCSKTEKAATGAWNDRTPRQLKFSDVAEDITVK